MTRPVPNALKRLHNTLRPDRSPTNEPQPPRTRPPCPAWLSPRAKSAWKRLAGTLHRSGLLTAVDRDALARYCTMLARWREAEEHLMAHGSIVKSPSGIPTLNPSFGIVARLAPLLSKLEGDFGMNPSARSKISAPPTATVERDPLQAIIDSDTSGTIARISP